MHTLSRICIRFDLEADLPDEVHHADLVALATERRDLMAPDTAIWQWLVGIAPSDDIIQPWSPLEARLTYHQRLMDQLAIEHRRKAA
jgi:hypothetical protein